MSAEQTVLAAGYKVATWTEFQAATDVPARMRVIADKVFARWAGDFVVYDPAGGDDGWLLIDDDRAQIIGETVEHLGRLAEPAAPPPAQGALF
ncbi:hypothetical protein [Bradyrhizobium sp. 174]|uniref:hypothetical protein n=1 Tax=Bradyrhizobium sp. 174 TaxID=2782645 RepID=UPI001FF7FC2E|nr:hypothetical protein [Bradyrhizobium sp. 174]MCK1577826.1 hypothetical protein [Bradyrhizobium sp. 174]